MFAEDIRCAVMAASRTDLPKVAGKVWKAYAAGLLDGDRAQELAELIEARKAVPVARPAPRHVGSKPRSGASLERRRRWVASGMMPPAIACSFTMGEGAVLAVIAAEARERGDCRLTVGAIAALAGVSERTARNALREAKRLGVLVVQERRLSSARNLSNIVTIAAPEWISWLRLAPTGRGGCKILPGTNTNYKNRPFAPFESRGKASGRAAKDGTSGIAGRKGPGT